VESSGPASGLPSFLAHFRDAFPARPAEAYREWFRLQEELRDTGQAETARVLSDDLWNILPVLSFPSSSERARFFHNLGAFFGSAGPAADLSRARECFAAALSEWSSEEEGPERARALHNFAGAITNLAESTEELDEAVALYERALEWRSRERPIARAVTLHNLGIACRRLAELAADRRTQALERSEDALREALEIRERQRLPEGHASSLFQLGLTLRFLGETEGVRSQVEAQVCLERAAKEFEALGMACEAARARRHEEESEPV